MSIMSTLDWLVFGANEHGTRTTEDGTSYIVCKGSGEEVWTIRQTLGWPRTPGRPILGPPPPGARYVEASAPTLEAAKEMAEQWERERVDADGAGPN
jgi:hypothetical protein